MPWRKSRPVRLGAADRQLLAGLVRTGSHPAQQARRARILLALDENDPDREAPVPTQAVVAERVGVCTDMIVKVSKAYADRGGDVSATITLSRDGLLGVSGKARCLRKAGPLREVPGRCGY